MQKRRRFASNSRTPAFSLLFLILFLSLSLCCHKKNNKKSTKGRLRHHVRDLRLGLRVRRALESQAAQARRGGAARKVMARLRAPMEKQQQQRSVRMEKQQQQQQRSVRMEKQQQQQQQQQLRLFFSFFWREIGQENRGENSFRFSFCVSKKKTSLYCYKFSSFFFIHQTRTVPSTAAPDRTSSSCLAPRRCRCSAVCESAPLFFSISERAVARRASRASSVGCSLEARSAER